MFKSAFRLGVLASAFIVLAPALAWAQAAYVVDSVAAGHITIINTGRSNEVMGDIAVGDNPTDIVISHDGSRIYVSNSGDGTVSVIRDFDATTLATIPVGPLPLGLALSPDGSTLMVAHGLSRDITVINTVTNTVTSDQLIPNFVDGPMVYSLDGTKLYAPLPLTGRVAVLDGVTGAVLHTINVGAVPRGIALSPDGATLYVANRTSNSISVIATATDTVTTSFPINPSDGVGPASLVISHDGAKLYVATVLGGVQVFDTTTHAELDHVVVSPLGGAFSLAITTDGSQVYATSFLPAHPVTVINTADDSTTSLTSPSFDTPTAIAFDQLPPPVPTLPEWALAALAAAMAGAGWWSVRRRSL